MAYSISWAYRIIEQLGNGDPNEEFGTCIYDHVLHVGEIITLRWLDNRPAYDVVVMKVVGLTAYVERAICADYPPPERMA